MRRLHAACQKFSFKYFHKRLKIREIRKIKRPTKILRYTVYHILAKECPWAEHLTSLPKRGVGALSSVSGFNHEFQRVPMYVYSD